jgi:glycosyltransferase involved in cell wall biosynthesis
MKIAMVAQHDAAVAGLSRTLARKGHHVVSIPAPGGEDVLTQIPEFSGPLRGRLRLERPDVVHALNWTSGLAALAATRDLDVPVVQTFSSLGLAGRGGTAADRPRLRLESAIGRSAQAVVGTSTTLVSELARMGVPRQRVRCIPWGVDTDMFTPEGPAARRSDRPRLLAFGAPGEREPLETLIWALTKVPDAELLINGATPQDETAYRKLIGSIGLSGRVVFTGQVGQDSLPALLRSADLVLSTGDDETSSLEAMACGRPVVAAPTGGHRDAIVDGTTGMLIPPGRPMLLAQRIRRLLTQPMLLEAYGFAGADRARSRYSWDRIATETVAVYEQLAAA